MWCFLVVPMMILSFGLQTFDQWHKWRITGVVINLSVVFIFLLVYAFSLLRMFDLKSHYRDNLRLLEELKQKLGLELPVHDEMPHEHPLLESWNRRLEKRALLWRLDAFLSRKQIKV